jgi:C4-dicarboxylate transporter DctQ subunit
MNLDTTNAPAAPNSAAPATTYFLGGFDRLLTRIEDSVILVSYSILICLVGFEVVRRLITGEQWLAGPEVALYAFIWLSWFAMVHNISRDVHLAFSEFRDRFPPRIRAAFESFDCLLWIGLGCILIWTSWAVVERNIQYKQVVFGTDVPLWVASVAIPVAWSFTMVRVVQRLVRIWTTGKASATLHVPQEFV